MVSQAHLAGGILQAGNSKDKATAQSVDYGRRSVASVDLKAMPVKAEHGNGFWSQVKSVASQFIENLTGLAKKIQTAIKTQGTESQNDKNLGKLTSMTQRAASFVQNVHDTDRDLKAQVAELLNRKKPQLNKTPNQKVVADRDVNQKQRALAAEKNMTRLDFELKNDPRIAASVRNKF